MKKTSLDRWMNRLSLLVLAGTAGFLLLTAAGRSPGAWSTGVKITPENRERVCALLGHLLSTLKALLCGLFAWITVWAALAWPLPGWFLPAALGAVSGDLIYWFVRVFRAQ